MPREPGSTRDLAARLAERGIAVSHMTLHSHPERVAYDDHGEPIGYTPGEPYRGGGKPRSPSPRLPRWGGEDADDE